jgi:hypothetical protein
MLGAEKRISWLSLDETRPSRRMKLYSLLGRGASNLWYIGGTDC